MGTRSNTVIYDGDVQLLNMYRQHDGYLIGHGAELLAFLEPMTIVNGFTMGATNIANGAGCLAAQMVAHFKVRVGGIYIEPPMVEGLYENDYTYTIKVGMGGLIMGGVIEITVHEYSDRIFEEGSIESFKQFIEGM